MINKTLQYTRVLTGLIALCTVFEYAVANEQVISEGYSRTSAFSIGYGDKSDSVGMLEGDEIPTQGPESFAVSDMGDVYICDTVNNRVCVVSSAGSLNKQLGFGEGCYPADVVVDASQNVYVYDMRGQLHQYSDDGALLHSIDVDMSPCAARMEMVLINDSIYTRCIDYKDNLIGVIDDGVLRLPDDTERSFHKEFGNYAQSGRRYLAILDKRKTAWVKIIEPGNRIENTIEIGGDIVGVQFLAEDNAGNIYIKCQEIVNDNVVVVLYKYDSQGGLLETVTMPSSDSHYWAVRDVIVANDGRIYQMLPQKSLLSFNVFEMNE